MDGVTTACGLIDKCLVQHPHNRLLPIMTSIVLYNAGSVFRWMDARCRGKQAKTFLAEPGSSVARAAVLAVLYTYFGRVLHGGKFRNKVLVIISVLEIALEVLEDAFNFDAFAALGGPLCKLLASMQQRRRALNGAPRGGDAGVKAIAAPDGRRSEKVS
mmetsp:Transcript_81028/g.211205  ORF Transcript_81028/g.211205 Transcript_81028/m.211205 type:complete len:159 (-) Transcript_81028:43-519(-)